MRVWACFLWGPVGPLIPCVLCRGLLLPSHIQRKEDRNKLLTLLDPEFPLL